MLTERQKEILKIIVLEYIKLAKPVSSNLICDTLHCSSATIRSEMATLEEYGLLEKTHTSSGRIPSEKGYRYYVDNLMSLKKMSPTDMLKLQIIFNNNQLEISDSIAMLPVCRFLAQGVLPYPHTRIRPVWSHACGCR